MKRFLCLSLSLLLLLFSLSGCTLFKAKSVDNVDLSNLYFEAPNYNNYGDLLIDGDTAVYSHYGIFGSYLCLKKDGTSYQLFDENELEDSYFSGPYYGLGNAIYFPVYPNDAELDTTAIYRYRLDTKELERVLELSSVYRWLPMEHAIVYLKEFDAYSGIASLYYYDFTEKTEHLIATEVEEFDITDSLIRYVVYEDGYHFYSYDPLLDAHLDHGTATLYSRKETVNFYFSNDRAILFPETANTYQEKPEFAIYDLTNQTVEIYDLPALCYTFLPGDQYAYALTYSETDDDDSSLLDQETDDVLYQIDLTTGTATLLEVEADNLIDIYLDAEDQLYLLEYPAFAGKTQVYRYDPTNKTTEKLFRY